MLNQTRNPGESVYFRCQVSLPWKLTSGSNIVIQIDMSKCMVAFIDWYHEGLDGSARKKVKVERHFRRHFIKILLFLSSERPRRRPSHPSDLPGEPGPWGTLHLCCRQWWDECWHDLYQPGLASCSAKSLSQSPQHFLSKIFQFSVKLRPRLIFK